jgi:hypothetical protein
MALVNFYLTREAALAIFVPSYLIVIAGAPYYRCFAKNTSVRAFVQRVAAVGAIAGAALIFDRRSLIDLPTISIAVITFALLSFTKIPESCAPAAFYRLRVAKWFDETIGGFICWKKLCCSSDLTC